MRRRLPAASPTTLRTMSERTKPQPRSPWRHAVSCLAIAVGVMLVSACSSGGSSSGSTTTSRLSTTTTSQAQGTPDERYTIAVADALRAAKAPKAGAAFSAAQLIAAGHAFCTGLQAAHATVFDDFSAVGHSLRGQFRPAITPKLPDGDLLIAVSVGQAAVKVYCPQFTASLG